MNKTLIHYPKKDIINSYFIALIPLLIFGFYKNGLMLYINDLVSFKMVLLPLYFYVVSIGVALIVAKIFKENSKYNILLSLIISASISINTNMIVYPILLFVMFSIVKYLKLRFKIVFNDLAIIRLVMLLALFLSYYSYLNMGEKIGAFNYNLMDIFLGFGSGGLASTSSLVLLVSLSLLVRNRFYKKEIALSSILTFVVIGLLYVVISNDKDYLVNIINGNLYFAFIFIAPHVYVSPVNKKSMIIYGILIGFIASLLSFVCYLEAGYISVFIGSLFIPLFNKISNKKYLKNI